MTAYKPTITSKREWILSELDVEWLATGCYILGCGGGGNPQHVFLALRNLIREGYNVKVVDLEDMTDTGSCLWGGGIGSPEVSMERLIGEEYTQACRELIEFMRVSLCRQGKESRKRLRAQRASLHLSQKETVVELSLERATVANISWTT
jgi:hypothetical protein